MAFKFYKSAFHATQDLQSAEVSYLKADILILQRDLQELKATIEKNKAATK